MFLVLCGSVLFAGTRTLCFNKFDFVFLVFAIGYGWLNLIRRQPSDRWTVVQLIACVLLYFYFRHIKLKKQFFILLFIAGLLQAIWSLLQIREILPSFHYLLKGTGCFSNPAILGLFVALSAIAGLALYNTKFGIGVKLFWFAGIVLLLSCILLSKSRASCVALFAGGMWMFFTRGNLKAAVCLKTVWRKHRIRNYLLLVVLGGAAVCFILYGLYYIRPVSVDGRFLIWRVIGSHLTDSLWFGHGPLQALYMPLQAAWFETNPDSALATAAGNNIYAFNEFLRTAFETGITGLVLFAGNLAAGLYYALKGNQSSRDAGGLLLTAVCFGLFSYPFSVGLIMAVVIITLAVISQNTAAEYLLVFRPGIWGRRTVYLLGCSFLIFTAVEYRLEKKADLLLQEARYNPAVLTGERLAHYYKRLQGNPDFILCYGKTLYDNELYAAALPVLEQACRLKPSSGLLCDLGRCYQYGRQYNRAGQAYSLAARMTPAYIFPQYRLFCLYQETGEVAKATEKAKYMLAMPVKVVNTSVLRYRNQARIFLKNQELLQ